MPETQPESAVVGPPTLPPPSTSPAPLPPPESPPPPVSEASADFIAGTAAGVAGLLVGHPFDTIKVRLQLEDESKPGHGPGSGSGAKVGGNGKATGMKDGSAREVVRKPGKNVGAGGRATALDAFRNVVKEEGFFALYKGITSPLLGMAAMNATVFGTYGLLLRSQMVWRGAGTGTGTGTGQGREEPKLGEVLVAGSGAGVVTSFVTSPIELLKIIEQQAPSSPSTSKPQQPRRSTFPLLMSILRERGIRGLYRGLGATICRDVAYGPYFLSYEVICRLFHRRRKVDESGNGIGNGREEGEFEVPWEGMLVAGAVAGTVSWTSTFHFDVIKTRVQSSTPWIYVPVEPTSSSSLTRPTPAILSTTNPRFPLPTPPTNPSGSMPTTTTSSMNPGRIGKLQTSQMTSLTSASSSLVQVRIRDLDREGREVTTTRTFRRVPHPYRSVWSTAVNSYREEGWRVFFRGLGPTILRAVPVNMVTFFVFELVVKALH